jgi:hypothetical protein
MFIPTLTKIRQDSCLNRTAHIFHQNVSDKELLSKHFILGCDWNNERVPKILKNPRPFGWGFLLYNMLCSID